MHYQSLVDTADETSTPRVAKEGATRLRQITSNIIIFIL